jgi:hypothetical protein
MPLNTQDIEHFLNQARIKLPGASDTGIKAEFYEVCKEFLEDSNAWVEHVYLPVTAGVQEYNLIPKRGGQIIRLSGVFDGNRIPVAATMPEFGRLHIRWPINISSIVPVAGAPYTLSSSNPYLVAFVKNLDEPTTKDMLPVVPEFLLKVYSIHVLDGLLGKMMGQQAKSFSNAQMSLYHLKRFRTGINIAKVAALRQNTQGAQNWMFPRGWRANTQRGGMVTAWPAETF